MFIRSHRLEGSPAIWLGDGYRWGDYTSGPYRWVTHTTETASRPGYNSGRSAPHITIDPLRNVVYQHQPFNLSAGALQDGSQPVRTNRDSAIQCELICYSNRTVADKYGRLWVGDLTDGHYNLIAEVAALAAAAYNIPAIPHPLAVPSGAEGYGVNGPYRMSVEQWDTATAGGQPWGFCEHKNVPDSNTHWDAAAFDTPRLCRLVAARLGLTPPKETPVGVPDYAKAAVAKAEAGGFISPGTAETLVPRYDLMVWLDRLGALEDFRVDESGDVDQVNNRVAALEKQVEEIAKKTGSIQVDAQAMARAVAPYLEVNAQ